MRSSHRPSPPVPRVTLRVGVSGHRPNRLERSDPAQLQERIRHVLTVIQQVATHSAEEVPPTLRLLSSLAEGADRLVASAALDLGYVLQVPLPFPEADYLDDFEAESSRDEFRALLRRASTVVELAAPEGERARGYRAAGQIIVDQCDFLMVVWDGEPGRGIGGTPEMIERAESVGLAVIRIDAVAPHPISFRGEADWLAALTRSLETLLKPHAAAAAALSTYQNEAWPTRIPLTSFLFVRLFGEGRWRTPAHPQWNDTRSDLENAVLQPYFRWTDALANQYGELSRSAALRIQLLATSSAICGLLSIPFDDHPLILRLLSSLELATTLSVVIDAFLLARKPWHARWLLYRSLAEHLRSLDLLAPLARSFSVHSANVSSDESGSEAAFAPFYLGGIVRQLGLLGAVVTPEFLEQRQKRLAQAIADQAGFQARTAERYETLERTLHRSGFVLFLAAVALSFYDVAHAFGVTRFTSAWILTSSALFPAVGAALSSISTQGEYKRLADRARALSRTLDQKLTLLSSAEGRTLGSLAVVASSTADVLTSEVEDWQTLISTRKPSLPI